MPELYIHDMRASHEGAHAPTILFGQQHWPGGLGSPGTDVDLPPVRYYHMGLIRRGSFRMAIGGERARLGEGDIFVVQPQVPWTLRLPRKGEAVLLAFAVRAAAMRLDPGQPALKMHPGEPTQPTPEEWWGISIPAFPESSLGKQMAESIRYIGDMWWRGDWERLRANAALAQILHRLALWYAEEGSRHELDIPGHPAVQQAMTGFFASPAAFRTVADLAASADMAIASFSRRFRHEVGESPGTWLRHQRLRLARDLLRDSDLPIHGVAQELGFADAGALSRQFRSRYGCTPRAWRRHGVASEPGG